jgi:glycosyltransferase involved in cell wall biosynthesis
LGILAGHAARARRSRVGLRESRAPLARAIICVSEHDRRLALRCRVGRRARLYTVRLGIADTDFPLADAAVEPARLVMVARFNEQKDQATLLRAWAQLASSGELGEATLDFIGSGPSLEACTELSQVLGVGGSVSFLGDRADVPEMLSRAQAFVLATHYEGLPVSILEAMRAGLPVVASDVGGVREEVAHGKTGLLVRRGDVGALADALRQIIRSPDERASLGRAGRDKYLQEFSTARMLAQTGAIYERVLTGRRGL